MFDNPAHDRVKLGLVPPGVPLARCRHRESFFVIGGRFEWVECRCGAVLRFYVRVSAPGEWPHRMKPASARLHPRFEERVG